MKTEKNKKPKKEENLHLLNKVYYRRSGEGVKKLEVWKKNPDFEENGRGGRPGAPQPRPPVEKPRSARAGLAPPSHPTSKFHPFCFFGCTIFNSTFFHAFGPATLREIVDGSRHPGLRGVPRPSPLASRPSALSSSAFTLIEVIVGSIVCLIIMTGLALALQSGIIVSKSSFGMSECIRHAQDGYRLLAEGDNDAPSPHCGLLSGDGTVRVNLGPSRFYYRVASPAGDLSFDVWVRNGQLYRQQRPWPGFIAGPPPSINNYPPTPPYPVGTWGPVKVLMGGSREADPSGVLLSRVVVATPTAAFPLFGINDGWPPGTANRSASISLRLFFDLDGDNSESGNEVGATFSTYIYFRNSDQ